MDLVVRCLILFPLVLILTLGDTAGAQFPRAVRSGVAGCFGRHAAARHHPEPVGHGSHDRCRVTFAARRCERVSDLTGTTAARLMEGEPVCDRTMDRSYTNLQRERITLEELASQARLVQISDLGEVRWAGLETNGRSAF